MDDARLSNSPGIADIYSCPACYEDHLGRLDGHAVLCKCGQKFRCYLEYEPVCYSQLIDEDGNDIEE